MWQEQLPACSTGRFTAFLSLHLPVKLHKLMEAQKVHAEHLGNASSSTEHPEVQPGAEHQCLAILLGCCPLPRAPFQDGQTARCTFVLQLTHPRKPSQIAGIRLYHMKSQQTALGFLTKPLFCPSVETHKSPFPPSATKPASVFGF